VIGIRTTLQAGRTTYTLEPCGAGLAQNSIITFDEGKRCWINKVIFGEPEANQLAVNTDPAKRPVFVAAELSRLALSLAGWIECEPCAHPHAVAPANVARRDHRLAVDPQQQPP
jgi:hypothetical protein